MNVWEVFRVAVAWLILGFPVCCLAVEFSGFVVDGLNRPIADVEVFLRVECSRDAPILKQTRTARDGKFSLAVDGPEGTQCLDYKKEGYERGYSSRYDEDYEEGKTILMKWLSASDVALHCYLSKDNLRTSVR